MPDGFSLSPELFRFAIKHGVENPEAVFEVFKSDRSSKGVLYSNWDDAVRTWFLRERQFGPSNGQKPLETQTARMPEPTRRPARDPKEVANARELLGRLSDTIKDKT